MCVEEGFLVSWVLVTQPIAGTWHPFLVTALHTKFTPTPIQLFPLTYAHCFISTHSVTSMSFSSLYKMSSTTVSLTLTLKRVCLVGHKTRQILKNNKLTGQFYNFLHPFLSCVFFFCEYSFHYNASVTIYTHTIIQLTN